MYAGQEHSRQNAQRVPRAKALRQDRAWRVEGPRTPLRLEQSE